jgi:hypothetical protein
LNHPGDGLTELLETYDAERRPIAERVAKTSLHNMRAHALVLDAALGLDPNASTDENVKEMEPYFDLNNQHGGAQRRAEVESALKKLDVEFYASV